jgi:predicted metal-dependent HD superfamily phosphohydrolase
MIDLYLQHVFVDLVQRYNQDAPLTAELWKELETRHSETGRHYHTLDHLQHLLSQLEPYKKYIADWDALLFTLFYHDSIYDVLRSDNESQSAELAVLRMQAIGVPEERIARTKEQILATQRHISDDPDTLFFLDADLSVLGAERMIYQRYAANVRKEYDVFPDETYNPGRKKVLEHFLFMDRIYKTEAFYNELEAPARENLEWEKEQL